MNAECLECRRKGVYCQGVAESTWDNAAKTPQGADGGAMRHEWVCPNGHRWLATPGHHNLATDPVITQLRGEIEMLKAQLDALREAATGPAADLAPPAEELSPEAWVTREVEAASRN